MIENGSKWARAGLVFGVIASVAGNVSNACLTQSQASIILRVPLAVVWPVALFLAVEVLVRNRAARGPLARIGQAGLLSVTVPTAITSFVNLHALMIKAGEPGMAQLTGPLAIDGLMLGCTVMMLAARVMDTTATPVAMSVDMTTQTAHLEDMAASWMDGLSTRVDTAMDTAPDTIPSWMDGLATRVDSTTTPAVPVIPGPVSAPPALARSNEVKPESVPATAVELFQAWAAAPIGERPTASTMWELVGAAHGKTARTARRWYAAWNA
jgi:hypothetical protein